MALGNIVSILTGLAPATAKVADAGKLLSDVMAKESAAADKLTSAYINLLAAHEAFAKKPSQINALKLELAQRHHGQANAGLINAEAETDAAAEAGQKGVGKFEGLGVAVLGATGAFAALTATVIPFVDAFSPSTVELFNATLRDTTAVIGSALQPVLSVMTAIAREVGDLLLPIMQDLTPIFAQLAAMVQTQLTPVLNILATLFTTLVIPVIEAYVGVMQLVVTAFRGVATAVEALVGWLADFFGGVGGEVKDFFADLNKVVQNVVSVGLALVATFAQLIGAVGFITKMVASLRGGTARKASSRGFAAARGARFTNSVDYGKSVALAAFTATGEGAKDKTTEEWLKTLADDLEKIANGDTTIVDKLVKQLLDGLEAFGVKWFNLIRAWLMDLKPKIMEAGAGASNAAASGSEATGVSNVPLLGSALAFWTRNPF